MPDSLYEATLLALDETVHRLSQAVPAPKKVPFLDSFVFRHIEQLPTQAIVQKLSRLPSLLRASLLLLENGLFQEQATLQRVLDEIGEDVALLSIPLLSGEAQTIHQEFLDAFFAEEFDFTTGKPGAQNRPMVRRSKIRAYIAQSNLGTEDPSGHIDATRTISKAYSGYVHAASPQIMDTYGGDPPHFHTAGMLGTDREPEHRRDIQNYFYRAVSAALIASKALGNEQGTRRLFLLAQIYERRMGI